MSVQTVNAKCEDNIDRERCESEERCRCNHCIIFSDEERKEIIEIVDEYIKNMNEECVHVKKLRKDIEGRTRSRMLAICDGLDAGRKEYET